MRRRCLVVHPGALGDVLLAGPALRHLRDLGYRPTLAVLPWLVPLFATLALITYVPQVVLWLPNLIFPD